MASQRLGGMHRLDTAVCGLPTHQAPWPAGGQPALYSLAAAQVFFFIILLLFYYKVIYFLLMFLIFRKNTIGKIHVNVQKPKS